MGINLVTGDTHGTFRELLRFTSGNWPFGQTLTKEDNVIILGDFGFLNHKDKESDLRWLNDQPWTTLFIDGNHDNFDILDELPTRRIFGADVGRVSSSIFHLRRGRVYTINGDRIFTFGGGLSIDKMWRQIREVAGGPKHWWAREYPSLEELDLAWKNIMKHESVDYVLSHACPEHMLDYYLNMSHHSKADHDLTSLHLRDMSQVLRFTHWYHGHMHVDVQCHPKYISLYHKILKLGEELEDYGHES